MMIDEGEDVEKVTTLISRGYGHKSTSWWKGTKFTHHHHQIDIRFSASCRDLTWWSGLVSSPLCSHRAHPLSLYSSLLNVLPKKLRVCKSSYHGLFFAPTALFVPKTACVPWHILHQKNNPPPCHAMLLHSVNKWFCIW